MNLIKKNYNGIPLYIAENLNSKVMILLFHGFLSSTQRQNERTEIMEKFYNAGFSVTAIDSVKHGERADFAEFNKMEYLKKERELFYIVEESSKEIDDIIDILTKEKKINNKKVFCCGLSMGGLISWKAASNSKIDGAIIMAATPYFKRFAEYNLERKGDKLTREEIDFLEQIEPFNNIELLRKKTIFIASGSEDIIIPSFFSEEGYKALNKKQNNLNIVYKVYKGGHSDNIEMINGAIKWLLAEVK